MNTLDDPPVDTFQPLFAGICLKEENFDPGEADRSRRPNAVCLESVRVNIPLLQGSGKPVLLRPDDS